MTMIFCRGCGKEIHESAISCPHCGAPTSQNGNNSSPKSRITAGILAILLGGIGIHKFYVGAWGWGLLYILFCMSGLPAIMGIIEGIRYLTLSDEKFRAKASAVKGPFAHIW